MIMHVPPPHRYCWVYTKWGRKKARVIMEYLQIGGEDHGESFVSVVLQDTKITIFDRNISVKRKNIEYIED